MLENNLEATALLQSYRAHFCFVMDKLANLVSLNVQIRFCRESACTFEAGFSIFETDVGVTGKCVRWMCNFVSFNELNYLPVISGGHLGARGLVAPHILEDNGLLF